MGYTLKCIDVSHLFCGFVAEIIASCYMGPFLKLIGVYN